MDYYGLLGVEKEATGEEIKKAYRRLARAYHPDLNQDKPGCEDHLKKINAAYQVLGNQALRQHYDLQLRWASHVSMDRVNATDVRAFYGNFRCAGKGFGMRGCGRRKWRTR